ncbi:putative CRN1-a coronin [Calocera cornea HHB12733]|uniref:Coronin n=1 Tax=Calocera cornea HHB12733 TaxID=1353952 RepID=A0A165HB13_9BASI|nr:putative CRN1-a coronin [Calocera cornea HHB12733]
MSRFVRPSKYRHVFGQQGKKEFGLENLKVSNSAWDTNMIDASGKYLSLNWNASGGGAFAILPLPSPFAPLPFNLHTKLPDIIPLARGHSAPVLDTAWSPHDDSVVASAGEDGRVLIWKVEEEAFVGWGADKWEPVDFSPAARIQGSGRKVGQVLFHPTAAHVLATASGDHMVRLYDLGSTDEPKTTLVGHTDTIQSVAFNYNGSLLVTTCRDRKVRLFDPRAGGEAVRSADGHPGVKGARVAWMGDMDRFATTGFSRMSDRQVGVWDAGSLKSEKMTTVDQSSGVLMPFWSDNNILFLAGKGDGNVRYYEYESGTLYPLSEYKSSDPQRGMCFLPRRALNVAENEIARAYKVVASGIEPVAFICPRKADAFQADIFPPAPSAEPSLTAGEFFTSTKPITRKVVDLATGSVSVSSTPVKSASLPTPTASAPTPAPAPQPARQQTEPLTTPSAVPTPAQPIPTKKIEMSASSGPLRSPVSPSPTRIEVSRSDSFRILTPKPEPEEAKPERVDSPDIDVPEPATRVGAATLDGGLTAENEKLKKELAASQAQVRELQIQIDSIKEAQRAAKALLLG